MRLDLLEWYSSLGPNNAAYTGGSALKKPDICGPDATASVTYPSFYGTSASSPHLAGAAALVKSAYPSYSALQIRTFLEGRAIDMGTAGKDNTYGWGRAVLGPPPPRGSVQFKSVSYRLTETGGSVRIEVSRTGGSYGAASINYATANGTASAGSDYTSVVGTINWLNGETADQFFDVPILDDSVVEGPETFTVSLNGAVGASLGSPDVTTVTIADNDGVNLALASRGSTITGSNGANWSNLINGVTTGYTGSAGFGYTVWSPTFGTMTLDLKGLCTSRA